MNDENASNKLNIKLINKLINIFPINYALLIIYFSSKKISLLFWDARLTHSNISSSSYIIIDTHNYLYNIIQVADDDDFWELFDDDELWEFPWLEDSAEWWEPPPDGEEQDEASEGSDIDCKDESVDISGEANDCSSSSSSILGPAAAAKVAITMTDDWLFPKALSVKSLSFCW